MILEGCSDFNCMVADLTDNSSLLEIQDIERLIQSSQFHFLPSVLLPTLSPPRPPICRQLSYLNFMQACIHPKGKKNHSMYASDKQKLQYHSLSFFTSYLLFSAFTNLGSRQTNSCPKSGFHKTVDLN